MNLVLSHGIFGFATLLGIDYFNGVKERLTNKFPELRILVTQVSPDGTIEVRGTELGEQISKALEPGGALNSGEPVHIIAHSMGGLDARYLLSPDNRENMADRITSLTTIGTPHKGSPIADLLVKIGGPLDIGHQGNLLAQALHQAHIEVGGLRRITTEGTREFNDKFRDNENTRKFSVAGVGRSKQGLLHLETCVALGLPHSIIKDETGEENDGLVSLSSAMWGTEQERWPADHADEIGHNLDGGVKASPTQFDHLAKYEALVERLKGL
jgi:triacylglycerol lipase